MHYLQADRLCSALGGLVVQHGARLLAAAALLISLTSGALADKLHLTDGTVVEVDAAWEDGQGVWYRRDGVTHLLDRARVKKIEPAARAETLGDAAQPAPAALLVDASAQSQQAARPPVLIYLVGGASFEVDDVTEAADGIWYRRANLSIFIARARIERVERERPTAVADADGLSGARLERRWTTGRAQLDALIRQNGLRYGVDPYLIFCVMEQESHFNAGAVSPAGARGLMQLMPGTARRFGVRRVHDPAQNVMGGTRYLKELMTRFRGRVELVLASYNAGEGAVERYGQRIPPYRETRNYVRRVGGRYGRTVTAGSNSP